jgi:hypothetical protein
MCPVCIATAAYIATGATSAGGLTALAIRKARAKHRALATPHNTNARRTDHDAEPG